MSFYFRRILSLSFAIILLCNAQMLFGQLHTINTDKIASRPVVKNGRVLVNSQAPAATITNPLISLALYDSRAGKTSSVTDQAEIVFSGWPDLDAGGNVAYVQRKNGKSVVTFFDGTTHTQISDNPSLPNSPSLGLAKDKVKIGFVVTEGGYVIFRDSEGNIFAYDHKKKSVQKITASEQERVNVDDGQMSNPRFAMVRQYQFDGKTLFWMHQKVITDGEEGEITVYKAEAPFTDEPKIIATFRAWIPPAKSFIIGQFAGPFLVACGSEAAWQYYPPGKVVGKTPGLPVEFGTGYIDYYDGTSTTSIYGPGPVRMQSIRLYAGHLIWPTGWDKETDKEYILQYRGGHVSIAVEHDAPPPSGGNGALHWGRIGDVEFDGFNVLYSMDEVECKRFGLSVKGESEMCQYIRTGRVGLFTDGGTLPLYTVEKELGYDGGLEFQGGLCAFISGTGIDRDIGTIRVHADPSSSAANVSLRHIGPDHRYLDRDSTAPAIADRFSISTVVQGCGSKSAGSAELNGITLHLSAESGVMATIEDITKVELYHDVDRDGVLSAADVFLFSTPIINQSIETFFSKPLIITGADEAHFFVRLAIRPEACPCNAYIVSASAADLEFVDKKTLVIGSTAGKLQTPTVEFGMYTADEMYGGDYQTGTVEQKLPKKLGVRVEHFNPRCGQVRFTIVDPPGVDGAALVSGTNRGTSLSIPLKEDGGDGIADVDMVLGKREGKYFVKAEIEFAGTALHCPPPSYTFIETAGQLAIEIVDLSDPHFVVANPITRPDGRMSYKVSVSDGGANHENLANGGAQRVGMTADGDNLVLVRARFVGFTSNPGGTVDFAIVGAGDVALTTNMVTELPGDFTGTKGTSSIYESKGNFYALAIIRAPKHLPGTDKTNLRITVTYSKKPITLAATENLTMIQPPVLFVHGMWSKPLTWKSPFTEADRGFEIHTVDYSADAAKSFTVSGETLKTKILEVLKRRRDRSRISTSQVCVVAHSMGGLVTRQHVADVNGQNYYLPENFGQGNIHKFISIGTPHWGSPISALVVRMRDHSNELVRSTVIGVAKDLRADIISGAVDAMCPGSDDLKGLGETPIPTHTIVGWIQDTRVEPFSYKKFGFFLLDVAKNLVKFDLTTGTPGVVTPPEVVGAFCTRFAEEAVAVGLTDLYSADRTDILVTKVSQIGGIATYTEFDNTIHSGSGKYEFETGSVRVAKKVFELLRAPVDNINIFSPKMPASDIQDPAKVCGE